jgi:hypothetical protein
MRPLRVLFCVLSLLFAPAYAAPAAALEESSGEPLQAYAQKNDAAPTRMRAWTRERWDAARKRWARNQQKFTACSLQLAEKKKERRMSLDTQKHFLNDCMRQQP